MSITLCCQYLEFDHKKQKYFNLLNEKTVRLTKHNTNPYSCEQILELWIYNVNNLKNCIKLIHNNDYKSFRISSAMFPLWDFFSEIRKDRELLSLLKEIGNFALENNMRLSSHPDQFVVLSSDNQGVIDNSIKILSQHAWMMDCLNLPQTPFYAINIHGGKRDGIQKLIESINKLPNNIKNRLTLENDELCYSVIDLFQVYQATGIPICFDSHHHTFNTANLTLEQGLDISLSTWPKNIRPQTHLSNSNQNLKIQSFSERRKHSDYVHYIPEYQKQLNNENKIDIDFEFKMKNIAIEKACLELDIIK